VSEVAVGTIVGRNYVPFARVLADSLAPHHSDLDLTVVVADADDATSPAALGLAVPDWRDLCFRCTREELVVALKPFLLARLLDRAASALFLDADVFVLKPLDGLLEAVQGHALTLIPHALTPPVKPDRVARDLEFNRAGAFNGGIVGVSRTEEARSFLRWWQARLRRLCRHDVGRGIHFDQRWLDFAPAFVEDLHIHRDAGIDVAHWNLPERLPPYRVFHFSGFDPDEPERVTRYKPHLRVAELGAKAELFHDYTRRLNDAGWQETRKLSYGYASFDNGVAIPLAARRLYAGLPEPLPDDPFGNDFFDWLADGSPNRLWLHVHRERPDLQYAFPRPHGRDRRRFLKWIRAHGMREHDVPAELV
jgi:hypothetical protein